MRSTAAAVVTVLFASTVLAAPLQARQTATTAAAPAGSASDGSAVLDANIPILQAIAETDPSDANAVAALQQQLAALPADQQQAITALVSAVGGISQQFASVPEDTMHLIENYVTSNLSPLQMEFYINELTGQPAPNQPGGALPDDLSKQFKKLDADERKAYTLMALALGPTDKQMKYIQKKLTGSSSSDASATSQVASAASVDSDDDDDDDKKKKSSKKSSKKDKKKDKKKSKSDKKKSDKKKSSKKDDDDDDDDKDDDDKKSSNTKSTASATSASASSAAPSTDADDIQAQLACLSADDANTLLQQLQAQGASDSDLQSVAQQIPALTQQGYTPPSSCSAASKRSLNDLD